MAEPPSIARNAGAKGARATPRSVTIAVINHAGVTSNAGLIACVPAGASDWAPRIEVTSEARDPGGSIVVKTPR